jgi:tetratricopeptide (TPR) repeat protein
MPTKTKPAKKEAAAGQPESRLQEAIDLVSAGDAKAAMPMFEAIAREAVNTGNFALARVARNYVLHEKNKTVAPLHPEPIQEAVFLLNAKQTDEAMEKIDKILKKDGSNARAHYLKALVYAKAQQVELAAESLKSALALDPSILHIYRLEPEFKLCRRSSVFANFELA